MTSSPSRRDSIVPRSLIALFRSSTTGCRICRRANASSCRVSAAACWPERRICASGGRDAAVGGQRPLGDVGEPEDRGQQVVEVVGDAGGELADRLHLLRLAQLILVALARRQVAPDRLDGAVRAVGALDPGGDFERHAAPVLGGDGDLDRRQRAAVAGRPQQLHEARPRLRGDQVGDGQPDDLLAGEAGRGQAGPVDRAHVAVQIAGEDQVVRVLDQLAVALLALADGRGGGAPLGHVVQQHHVARRSIDAALDRHGLRLEGAPGAAGGGQRQVLAAGGEARQRPAGQRVIERRAGQLAGPPAEDRLGGAVEIGQPALRIDHEHAVAEVLDPRVAERGDRIEHAVVEDRDDGADAGAREQERRRVDVGDAVGLHQEDQVAEPWQQRRRDQDAAAPRVEVRRLERAGPRMPMPAHSTA